MADLPPPETIRQPTGDVVHVNNTQGLNTLSVSGKTYQILDVGYTCGQVGVTVLSEFTCLFSLFGSPSFCNVCPSCWHMEGIVSVPDWASCGIPAGQYGILVKFKPAWICKCLKQLGYVSANVNLIQPVGTVPYCGAPSIPPPLHGFNPFPLLVAGAAIGGLAAIALTSDSAVNSATLPNGNKVSFESDGAGNPYRPGIDSDIDSLPTHPPGTLQSFDGCPDEQPNNIKVDSESTCDNPSNPPNGTILTTLT